MRRTNLTIALCFLTLFLSAQFTLDNFSVNQDPPHETAVTSLSAPISWAIDPSIVGGEREIITQLNVNR